MLEHEILAEDAILIVRPRAPLDASDFESLTREVDPFLQEHGNLRGLLIEAEDFPGWENFAAMLSHFRFVRDHHRMIAKVAAAGDSHFLSIAPAIARHFVAAEIRHFDYADRAQALAWLREEE